MSGITYAARIAAARLSRFPLAALALAAAALALYAAGLRHPSVFDDDYILAYLDPLVPDAVPPRVEWLRWLATNSFVWVHTAFGRDIAWQRLANVLAHAGTGIVLFGFLARLFETVLGDLRARWLAFFGALWFVVHPVAVYGTAYLTQRSIVLATLFSLVALWCVLEGLQRRRAGLWYGAAAIAYVLALLCKEHAVMLPAVAIALVVLVRGVSFATLGASAPWLALAGLIAAAVLATRGALLGTAYEPFAGLIIAQLGIDPALAYPLSVENQAMLFCRYFATWLMPWPGWLAIDLRTPFPRTLLAWPYSVGFALWIGYAALGAWLLMQRGLRGLAGFALLFPWLLGLTEMATVRLQEPFVLYRSYLWMAGLPAALPALVAPLRPRGQIAALVVLCALLAAGAHGRLATFADPVALWDDAVRKNHAPGAPFAERPYVSRGLAHMERGSNEAFADFDRALRMNPRSPMAHLARGTLLIRTGRYADALADLDRAIEIDDSSSASFHKRCTAMAALGRNLEALADCRHAIELDSLNLEAWINQGGVLGALGRDAEAAASLERALQLNPGNPHAHFNYGVVLLNSGRRDAAVREHFAAACRGGMTEACRLARELTKLP